jgi:hypothetical protein
MLIIVGLAICAAVAGVLVVQERDARAGRHALASAARQAVPVEGAADGAIVHLTGDARTATVLRDPEFPVQANALRLDRVSEMYQWRDRRSGTIGNTQQLHASVWSDQFIDPVYFPQQAGHGNPAILVIPPLKLTAPDVTIGRWRIAPELLSTLPADHSVPFDQLTRVAKPGLELRLADGWLQSGDPRRPVTGDLRLRWAAVPQEKLSLVGRLAGGTIRPVGFGDGQQLVLAANGAFDVAALAARQDRSDLVDLWHGRAVGLFLAFIGGLGVSIAARSKRQEPRQIPAPPPAPRRKSGLAPILLTAMGIALVTVAGTMAAGWLLWR